jgi:hypothetical protein
MFKDLIKANKHTNMGFPIAEVEYDGTFNIAKEKNSGGLYTLETYKQETLSANLQQAA